MRTAASIRSRPLLWRVALSAVLLGVVSGLMCGLARSPIASVVIPSVLGLAAAAVGIGAERLSAFRLRWVYFSQFCIPFILAFAVCLAVGMKVNESQPKAYERFGDYLKAHGYKDREIAGAITAMVAAAPETVRQFDVFPFFYKGRDPAPTELIPNNTVHTRTCMELRPPTGGYTDINVLKNFRDATRPFRRIAKYIDTFTFDNMIDADRAKLLMLAAAHYGICR